MEVKTQFKEVFIAVVEEMAFIDAIPAHIEAMPDMITYAYRVPILMPYAGDVVVAFPENVAHLLTVNILGLDSRPQQTDVADAIAELLNVLAGRFFEYAYPGVLFEIGLPKVVHNQAELTRTDLEKQFFLTPTGAHIMLMHPKNM